MNIGCEKMNCEIQEKCGGCAYEKKQYAQQLKDKTEYVEKQLKKLKQNIKVNYCIGMENPYNYRNKGKI
jgi:23S rRNA (uracil1939-C5)-methyltransferase